MFKVHFVTGNKAKTETLQHIFENTDIEIVSTNLSVTEVQEEEVVAVALAKVNAAYMKLREPCVVHDGGFYIDALNGFPKAYAKFTLETIGIEGILKLVEGKDRSCAFVDVMVYMDETLKEPAVFEARVEGTLSTEPRGEIGKFNFSNYHKIFVPDDDTRTLAELSDDEHIARKERTVWCDKQFRDWLLQHINHENQ